MLSDVVRDDVVVPVGVSFRDDALREVGHRDIRVAPHAAIGDDAIIPVVTALDLVVDEGICRRDTEQVADAGLVVDRKRIAAQHPTIDLEIPTTTREVVFPRIAREKHPDATVGIDTEDRDVGVLIEAEVHPDALTASKNGRVVPVGPDLDTRTVEAGVPRRRGGHDGQAEQSDGCKHDASRPR